MTDEEKRQLLIKCKNSNYGLNHKYLGVIYITKIENEVFYADTSSRGEMPFLYNDLGLTISSSPIHPNAAPESQTELGSNTKTSKSDE